MAVELCKVNLWMEAIEPGKPLSFLDAHIQRGNSLLGATPALLAKGIPDSALEAIEGDDKKLCAEFKKLNRQQREGNRTLFDPEGQLWPWDRLGDFATSMIQLDEMRDDTVEDIHRKQDYYEQLVKSSGYEFSRLWADTWCAAFVWKKTSEFAYPITEEVFRNIEKNPHNIAPWMKTEIVRLREQYKFFHWHLAFPDVFRVPAKGKDVENEQAGWSGGFDVVLGNPPWERIKIQEKEWFAERLPDIANAANAAQRRRMIAALQHEDPSLYAAFLEDLRKAEGESQLIRISGRYPLCGRGDINTYSIFAETMRLVLSAKGRMGGIIPSGIASDDTTKYFFQNLMETKALVSLFDFTNHANIFPGVDSNTKFCLMTIAGRVRLGASDADFVFFARQTEDLQEDQRHFTLSASDIRLLNPNTRTCPIFRSKHDMSLTKAIYQRVPILIKEGPVEDNPWGVKFGSMFHMSNDSHLFRTRQKLEAEGWHLVGNVFYRRDEQCLPLYEGKMIWHYDHRYANVEEPKGGTFLRGSSESLSKEDHKNPHHLPLTRYWVHESHMPDFAKDGRKALLAFRDVISAAVRRTAIFSIVPVVPCNHKTPVIVLHHKRPLDVSYLATCLSSFIFDYVVRQKLGGTSMGFFILKQLPVLLPTTYTTICRWDSAGTLGDWILPRAIELTYTAWDLETFAKDSGYAGPPFRWDEERRFLLQCELDAAYFHLYGIEQDDVDYIMETFPIVKREDEKRYGEYRTKRVILEIYDEMRRAVETGEAYRTRLDPPPADTVVAHPPRSEAMLEGERQ